VCGGCGVLSHIRVLKHSALQSRVAGALQTRVARGCSSLESLLPLLAVRISTSPSCRCPRLAWSSSGSLCGREGSRRCALRGLGDRGVKLECQCGNAVDLVEVGNVSMKPAERAGLMVWCCSGSAAGPSLTVLCGRQTLHNTRVGRGMNKSTLWSDYGVRGAGVWGGGGCWDGD
jgi:hypothetical protein